MKPHSFLSSSAFFSVLSLVFLCSPTVMSKPTKGKVNQVKAKKNATDPEQDQTSNPNVTKLMGKFKWGMSPEAVLKIIKDDTYNEQMPAIKATKDHLTQDRLRQELDEKLKELIKNTVVFDGKTTPWDVSLVSDEFAHKNNESMIVMWGKEDRRFYFFHNAKLWKLYLAFNATLFEGKTFDDFATVMETRFGKAERKQAISSDGRKKTHYLEWPSKSDSLLRAIDNTEFYGNFCLVLMDQKAQYHVMEGRKIHSPSKKYRDPLIDAVIQKDGVSGDSKDNIVDSVTGRPVKDISGKGHSDRSDEGASSSKRNSKHKSKSKDTDRSGALDGVDF